MERGKKWIFVALWDFQQHQWQIDHPQRSTMGRKYLQLPRYERDFVVAGDRVVCLPPPSTPPNNTGEHQSRAISPGQTPLYTIVHRRRRTSTLRRSAGSSRRSARR